MADYTTSTYELTKLSKSIVHIHTHEPSGLNYEDALVVTELIDKLVDRNKFSVLRTTASNYYSTDRVRSLIASNRITDKRYAMAFVVSSAANRISAEFYLQFNQPKTLTKIFENETKALAWLKEEEAKQFPADK